MKGFLNLTEVRKDKMGSDPILGLITSMSLPAMFSMIVQALYNIVDSIFVAQISEEALTAVSLAYPVQLLLVSVAVGTGVGLNSFISRKIGEQNIDSANSAATHGIVIAVFSYILFAVFGIFFCGPFFRHFTSNQTIIKFATDYTSCICLFSLPVLIQINIEKTLQATGNMIYPMIFHLIGAVTNIILDPILIFGLLGAPRLGVLGAAVATVTGQFLAMVYSLYVVIFKRHKIKITFKNFRLNPSIIKDIYKVGLPAIVMQSISCIMVTILNEILINSSETAVSVLGIYFKVQSFVYMPIWGLTHGVMPIMGYNFGAKNKNRLMLTLKTSTLIAIIILSINTIIFFIVPDKIMLLFNPSYNMLAIGSYALRVISLGFIISAVDIMLSILFQAIGNGVESLIISIIRQMIVIVPSAYLLLKINLNYVWFAFPLSELASFIASILFFIAIYNRKLKDL